MQALCIQAKIQLDHYLFVIYFMGHPMPVFDSRISVDVNLFIIFDIKMKVRKWTNH